MKKAVVGIVRRGEGYAFLQRMDGSWTFPSGKVEKGESLDFALIREVEEETGLVVTPIFNLGSRTWGDVQVFYKVCQVIDGDLQLKEPDNFLSAQWMGAKDILKAAEGHFFAPVQEYLEGHTTRAVHAALN